MKIIKFDPDNVEYKKEQAIEDIKNAKQFFLITMENRVVSYIPCNMSAFECLGAIEIAKSVLYEELRMNNE